MVTRVSVVVFVLGLLVYSSTSQAKPDRVVLGYSATWFDPISPAADYHFDGLTHIARSFLHAKADGAIDVPPGYFDPQLQQKAAAVGVKLLMSLGGAADNADEWVAMASDEKARGRFVETVGRLMAEHHYDGVDIDWEPAPLTDAEGVAYVTLLKALRAKYPQAVLTTALPAGEYWVSHMDWAAVIASVDFVNVMTYDYAGAWGGIAAHGSNLFPPGEYVPQPEYSVAEGMANLIKNRKLPPEKLLLGLIFPGYRFRAAKLGDTFPKKPEYVDHPNYARTLDLLATGRYLSRWDAKAQQPYLQHDAGDDGGKAGKAAGDVISYESPESIRRKCEYARSLGVAGVMIWHVGADLSGRQTPLMDAVGQAFGVGPTRLGTDAVKRQIADLAKDTKPGAQSADGPAGDPDAELAKLRSASGIRAERQWRDATPKAGR